MPYRLSVDLPAVNGGANFGILTGKSPTFAYEGGKRTSDTPIGVKLTIALQYSRLSTLTVKFDHDPLPKVTDEGIEEACASCKFLYVQIPDAVIDLYASSGGGIGMTGSASTAQIVTLKG